jgi:hypothetical protein
MAKDATLSRRVVMTTRSCSELLDQFDGFIVILRK